MSSNFARYQRIAPFYDLLDLPFEQWRYRTLRPRLFAGLSGRILDAGVGTGRNFPFYPPGVDVVGVDISPRMLARAEERRRQSRASVALAEMDVTRLRFSDNSFDAAVASFLFCVLPEEQQAPALREIARVVRPGRPIRLLEYVRPQKPLRRFMSRLWEPWMSWAYGAGFDRRTEEHVREVGLEVTEVWFAVDDLIKLIDARGPERRSLQA